MTSVTTPLGRLILVSLMVFTFWRSDLLQVFFSSSFFSLARFSPDDKFSRHRVTLKMRFGLIPKTVELK
jgi:hypothetical protein